MVWSNSDLIEKNMFIYFCFSLKDNKILAKLDCFKVAARGLDIWQSRSLQPSARLTTANVSRVEEKLYELFLMLDMVDMSGSEWAIFSESFSSKRQSFSIMQESRHFNSSFHAFFICFSWYIMLTLCELAK